jgi:hypothetical protein
MSSITISLIVFACIFGGALLGFLLHVSLPEHHLGADSKDIVKLGMGLVGTMAALVLGLLVASAKTSYDAQSAELMQMAANVALLDRGLALYGPETKEERALLRGAVVRILDQLWSKDGAGSSPIAAPSGAEMLYEKIQALFAEERHPTLAPGPGIEYRDGYRQSPLVDVCTTSYLGFPAVAGHAGSLAHRHFHQFRPLRSCQRNRGLQLVHLRALGFRRNLLASGNVWALCRDDSDLQRPVTRHPRATRALDRVSRGKIFDYSPPSTVELST